MIAIVDYGMGNLGSVKKAFAHLKTEAKIVDSASSIKEAEKIVFPGVGAFKDAMEELEKRNIKDVLKKEIENNKPFLGLCLGLQLLFEESEEATGIKGLGIFKGKVKRFPFKDLKVPQIGWNQLKITPNGKNCPLLRGVKEGEFVYFVHSYYAQAQDEITAAKTDYGMEFSSIVARGNTFACQFHPEKSQKVGLKIIENFCKI